MNATPTPPERFGTITDSRPTDIPWPPMSWPPQRADRAVHGLPLDIEGRLLDEAGRRPV